MGRSRLSAACEEPHTTISGQALGLSPSACSPVGLRVRAPDDDACTPGGAEREQKVEQDHVRFWRLADINLCGANVRFQG